MESPDRSKIEPEAPLKPAPEGLRTLQDFLNTQPLAGRNEVFATPADLEGWLVEHGLLDADARLTRTDLGRALDVRTGIRALLLPSVGRGIRPEAMAQLDVALQGACPQIRFEADGTSRLDPGDFNRALGHLVALVLLTRAEGLWDRFKMCRNCRAAFYDYSRNRGSFWCTRRCGDKVRARRHRRRGRRFRDRDPRPLKVPALMRKLIEQDDT